MKKYKEKNKKQGEAGKKQKGQEEEEEVQDVKSRVNMTLQWRWVMKVPRENAVSAVDAGVPTGVTRMSITQFRR